jgi:UDP-GlcNAc:undecaprenyl-phosphate GlcNAc-1-phosphate transferase
MTFAYSFFVGLFVTLVTVAVLSRAAHLFGAIDRPGPRKVHSRPIPRVGGIGIGIGVLAASLIWMPLPSTATYVAGALVVVATGIWDDIRPLDYKLKILGQAVGITVLLSGSLPLTQLTLLGLGPVSPFISYPIAFVFIFFVTNAFNLFDGLDGLAGGCLVISIGAIALLALLAGDGSIAIVSIAMIGGVIGFLRFNSHPAVTFMGDAGSQFLGFSAGYLALLLVTNVNPALNIGLPLLVLGVPLLDTISVAVRRILQGRSPFQGDRQHLHHRLLGIGLSHAQTVTVLYAIQILMAVTAYVGRYQGEVLVVGTFAAYGAAIIGTIYWLERRRGLAPKKADSTQTPKAEVRYISRLLAPLARHGQLAAALLLTTFFAVGAAAAERPTRDVAILSGFICATIGAAAFLKNQLRSFVFRLSGYSASIIVCFLLIPRGVQTSIWEYWPVNVFICGLGLLVLLLLAMNQPTDFRLSPQDLLMALLVLVVPNVDIEQYFNFSIAVLLLQVSVLFYAVEYVLSARTKVKALIPAGAALGLLLVGAAGL